MNRAVSTLGGLFLAVQSVLLAGVQLPPDPRSVEHTYESLCARCHGARLEDGPATSLIASLGLMDEQALEARIREHDPRRLQGRTLSNKDVRALVIFIQEYRAVAERRTLAGRADAQGVVVTTRHSFMIETVVQDVVDPWAIAFLPDRRMLITERAGRLRLFHEPSGGLELVTGTPSVWSRLQGGLLDVAVHPNHHENGFVYLTYSEAASASHSTTTIARGRLVNLRWTVQHKLLSLSSDQYRETPIHFGSRIAFDGAGHVFFTIGDRGASRDAQDLSTPHGKIHRMLDDGRIPSDNPFLSLNGVMPSIWSFGHRNPQGIAFDPATQELWSVEYGPRGGDELNRMTRGANYGWPLVSFGMNYGGTAISGETGRIGIEGPVHHWTPSITPSAMDFYTGDRFPQWRNHLFVGGLVSQELRRLVLSNKSVVEEEVILSEQGRVRDVATGPDGFIYVALNGPDRIIRLIPVPRRESTPLVGAPYPNR